MMQPSLCHFQAAPQSYPVIPSQLEVDIANGKTEMTSPVSARKFADEKDQSICSLTCSPDASGGDSFDTPFTQFVGWWALCQCMFHSLEKRKFGA